MKSASGWPMMQRQKLSKIEIMATRKITQKPRKLSIRRNPEEAMRVRNYNFTVIFTPAEEGGYIVTCPALPGLVTEGDNLREARRMAREAVTGYVEILNRS